MQAWQYIGVGKPITLNEVPEPSAGPNDVVVDVRAAGICHSELGYLDGTLSPLLCAGDGARTLGHETAGIVSEVGAGVTDFKPGDQVVVTAMVDGPGTAEDGGFAAKVRARQSIVSHIPDGVPFDQAAASTDAGMTSYHAIARADLEAGAKIGIIGYGGLGSTGAQIAVALGYDVFVAEVREDLFPAIREIGVTDVAPSITAFAGQELDAIVDFAGVGITTAEACTTVRPGGRVVQVGLARPEATINIADLVVRQVELVGSLGGTVEDNRRVLQLIASGDVKIRTRRVRFEDVPATIAELDSGTAVGRSIIDYSATA